MDVDELFAGTHAALDALGAVDLDGCDRRALDGVLTHWKQVRSFCDVYEVRIARRARHLADQGGGETVEGVLGDGGRRPGREARAVAERERACARMPGLEEALAHGDVGSGHVDGVAAAMAGLDDAARAKFDARSDELVAQAKWQPVDAFARDCRELARTLAGDEGESLLERQKRQCRVRRWIDRITGMHHIHAELDPESGAKAWTAINALTGALRRTARATATADTADATGEADADPDVTAAPRSNATGTHGPGQRSGVPSGEPFDVTADPTHDDAPAPTALATTSPLPSSAQPSAPPPSSPQPSSAQPSAQVPSWEQLAAQALVELLTGARSVDRRIPEVAVHIDWRTLLDGLHDHSLCETSDGTLLPPSTVRRLCCRAEVFPVVLDGAGEALDVGHAQRLASRAQRRALRAMYRTCAHPGCPVEFDCCEIHHVIAWERGGPTDADNLLPLCSRHHHLVHEGGWTLHLGPHRVITQIRPDGTVHHTGSTVNRTARHDPPPPGRQPTAA